MNYRNMTRTMNAMIMITPMLIIITLMIALIISLILLTKPLYPSYVVVFQAALTMVDQTQGKLTKAFHLL